jgi:hypothetical protein
MLITDLATNQTDGTITPGDNLLIEGNKIKIIGLPQADGTIEPGIGIFLIPVNGGTPIPLTRLIENTPSRLLTRVDSTLPSNTYYLRIITRYSHNKLPMKIPRTIEYELPLYTHPPTP